MSRIAMRRAILVGMQPVAPSCAGRPNFAEPLMRTCSSSPKAAATGLEVRFRTSTLACLRADALVHRAATSASCLRG